MLKVRRMTVNNTRNVQEDQDTSLPHLCNCLNLLLPIPPPPTMSSHHPAHFKPKESHIF